LLWLKLFSSSEIGGARQIRLRHSHRAVKPLSVLHPCSSVPIRAILFPKRNFRIGTERLDWSRMNR
jgi:hypothetical protein